MSDIVMGVNLRKIKVEARTAVLGEMVDELNASEESIGRSNMYISFTRNYIVEKLSEEPLLADLDGSKSSKQN